MVQSWFGPVDGLLRTATALGGYFLITLLEKQFGWQPPFLVGEALAVLLALAISGLASTKIWALPTLHVVWKQGGVPIDSDTLQFRAGDLRPRRLIQHSVVQPSRSLLSVLVMKRLTKFNVRLRLRLVPTGILHVTEDLSASGVAFRTMRSGFEVSIPDLDQTGELLVTRVEWEPATPGLPGKCKVRYSLETPSGKGKIATRLVHLGRKVQVVDLTD